MSAISELLRLPAGPTDLAALSTEEPHGFDGDKVAGEQALVGLGEELFDLQERLFAEAYTGGSRRVLFVLQGMDTSGKGGIIEKAFGLLSPNGLALKSFKKPTKEELAHDFLWRIENALPAAGMVGVFDRSHYEDVLVAKVRELAAPEEIERRYEAINAWEAKLVESGTTLVKCFLHLSYAEQGERLADRLAEPDKQWKFKPGDLDERELWSDYQAAYATALERCHSAAAPWYVVPADRKWYRNWAVGQLLLEALRGMDLGWPAPDYDVAEQQARLAAQERG